LAGEKPSQLLLTVEIGVANEVVKVKFVDEVGKDPLGDVSARLEQIWDEFQVLDDSAVGHAGLVVLALVYFIGLFLNELEKVPHLESHSDLVQSEGREFLGVEAENLEDKEGVQIFLRVSHVYFSNPTVEGV